MFSEMKNNPAFLFQTYSATWQVGGGRNKVGGGCDRRIQDIKSFKPKFSATKADWWSWSEDPKCKRSQAIDIKHDATVYCPAQPLQVCISAPHNCRNIFVPHSLHLARWPIAAKNQTRLPPLSFLHLFHDPCNHFHHLSSWKFPPCRQRCHLLPRALTAKAASTQHLTQITFHTFIFRADDATNHALLYQACFNVNCAKR